MIYVNGYCITDVAPVKLVDINIGSVEILDVARERAVRSGAEFVRWRAGKRDVEIVFALLTENWDFRQNQLIALNKWAGTEPVRLTFDSHPGIYLTGVCTGLPSPSLRQWWEPSLRIRWTCYEPFWTAMIEKVVNCGTAFASRGSAVPYITIKDTISAGNISYSDGEHTMTFNSVPAGDLVIDLDKQTATVNGVSIMDKYTFASSFIVPKNSMTITGSGTVHLTDRWV